MELGERFTRFKRSSDVTPGFAEGKHRQGGSSNEGGAI
jgi:hypothetical protein